MPDAGGYQYLWGTTPPTPRYAPYGGYVPYAPIWVGMPQHGWVCGDTPHIQGDVQVWVQMPPMWGYVVVWDEMSDMPCVWGYGWGWGVWVGMPPLLLQSSLQIGVGRGTVRRRVDA